MSFNEGLFERADCTCKGSLFSQHEGRLRVNTKCRFIRNFKSLLVITQ